LLLSGSEEHVVSKMGSGRATEMVDTISVAGSPVAEKIVADYLNHFV